MNEKSAYYIDKIRELENEIFDLKTDTNSFADTIIEQQAEIAQLKAENEEQKCSDCGIVKEYYSRIKELEEEGNIYCPTCGSCGVEECCPPDKCEHLKCFYGESYAKSYRDLEKENESLIARNRELTDALHKLHTYIDKLELEISTWERRYLDISNEKDTALTEIEKLKADLKNIEEESWQAYMSMWNRKNSEIDNWDILADSMRDCLDQREKLISKLIADIVDLKAENDRLNKWKNLITNLKGEGQ